MNSEQTLKAALAAVENRHGIYAPPEQNFDRIANLWNAHLANRYAVDEFELDATDVAIMSALIKIGRLAETPDHEDSWIDLAGYAACGAEVSTVQMVDRDLPTFPYDKAVPAEYDAAPPQIDGSTNQWWRSRVFDSAAGQPAVPTASFDQVFPPMLGTADAAILAKKRAEEQKGRLASLFGAQIFRVGDKVVYKDAFPDDDHILTIDSLGDNCASGFCSCGTHSTYALTDLKHAADAAAQAKIENRK